MGEFYVLVGLEGCHCVGAGERIDVDVDVAVLV